ncbi:MAG: 3-oxoacyl-[acyl-carrier-protein] synthase III C-terminal domain-containing protein [Thermoplasmata archaeon]
MEGPGVVSYGLYQPRRWVSAKSIARQFRIPESVVVEKQGFRGKRVSARTEMPSAMALSAARSALSRARAQGVDPADIGLVVWCGSQWKDYHVWLASAYLQDRLHLPKAFAFDLSAMCAGSVFGLSLAKQFLNSDEDLRAVLLVGASKESYLIRPSDIQGRWMDNFADGGFSVVVARDCSRNRILGSDFLSDGSIALMAAEKYGGARFPASTAYARAGRAYLEGLMDEAKFRGIIERVSLPNFERVIRGSITKSGLRPEEVQLLILNHMKRSFQRAVLERVGVDARRSFYLEEFGHTQSADQFLALDQSLRRREFSSGPVVMAAAGAGYVWGSTVVQWG